MSISNNPPPFEAHSLHIEELIENAKQFLDGEPIASQGQADEVGKLLDMIRTAKKGADEQRAVEKKPHDDAAKAVQTLWKPLLERCDLAADTAKRALVPWLEKLEAEQRAEAERARAEAEQARRVALEAERQARDYGALDDAERAEQARKDADAAERAANRAGRAKAHAEGGSRAIGLRTYYRAEVTDPVEFGKWLWANRRDAYLDFLQEQAAVEARHGPKPIPGIIIHEERKAA